MQVISAPYSYAASSVAGPQQAERPQTTFSSNQPKFGCAISTACCASVVGVLGFLTFMLVKAIKKMGGAVKKPFNPQPSGRPV